MKMKDVLRILAILVGAAMMAAAIFVNFESASWCGFGGFCLVIFSKDN